MPRSRDPVGGAGGRGSPEQGSHVSGAGRGRCRARSRDAVPEPLPPPPPSPAEPRAPGLPLRSRSARAPRRLASPPPWRRDQVPGAVPGGPGPLVPRQPCSPGPARWGPPPAGAPTWGPRSPAARRAPCSCCSCCCSSGPRGPRGPRAPTSPSCAGGWPPGRRLRLPCPGRAAGLGGGRGRSGVGLGSLSRLLSGLGSLCPEGKLLAWWPRQRDREVVRAGGGRGGRGALALARGAAAWPLVAVTKSGAALCPSGRPPRAVRVTRCGHPRARRLPSRSGAPAKVGGRRNYSSALFPLHVVLEVPPAGLWRGP